MIEFDSIKVIIAQSLTMQHQAMTQFRKLCMNQYPTQVNVVQQNLHWHEIYGNSVHSANSYGPNLESINFVGNAYKTTYVDSYTKNGTYPNYAWGNN